VKRFLIFALLGPPLGFVTFFWGLLQAWNLLAGAPSTFDIHQVVLLPLAYLFGILPALAAALFDHVLAKRNVRWRVLWTTLLGYLAGFFPIMEVLIPGLMHPSFLLLFGLVGAVPAAVCSWLSGPKTARRAD
jgi:hypothetical protein